MSESMNKRRKKCPEGRGKTRRLVRERDGFTCADCGTKRTPAQVKMFNGNISGLSGRIKNLDVHHLGGMCGKKSRGYDKVEDMHILITLCHRCHYNRPEHRVKLRKLSTSPLIP